MWDTQVEVSSGELEMPIWTRWARSEMDINAWEPSSWDGINFMETGEIVLEVSAEREDKQFQAEL